MLNQLKFDLYKLAKSKTFLVFWIVPVLLVSVVPVLSYVVRIGEMSVLSNIRDGSSSLFLAVIIFSVLFSTKDFSSGYIKNVYSFSNKLYYILSKVIYLFAFCLAYLVVEFLVDMIFNFCFGPGIIYNVAYDHFPRGEIFLSPLTEVLNGTAIGVVCCLLCMLTKREYIVLVVALVYLFIGSGTVYSLINSIVGEGFEVQPYTLLSFIPRINYKDIFNSTILPGIIVPVCYIIVFGSLSWLILKTRNV